MINTFFFWGERGKKEKKGRKRDMKKKKLWSMLRKILYTYLYMKNVKM
jgi:hypothetical protein